MGMSDNALLMLPIAGGCLYGRFGGEKFYEFSGQSDCFISY